MIFISRAFFMKTLILLSIAFAFLCACAFSYFQFPKILTSSKVFTAAFALLSLSFPIYFFLRKFEANEFLLQGVFWASTIWMGFIFYFSIISLIFAIFRLLHLNLPHTFFATLFATLAILIFGYIQNRSFEIKELNLKIEKPLAPVKIVAVSDLHLGFASTNTNVKNLVEEINKQKPALILIVGDLIDDNVKIVKKHNFAKLLRGLNAPVYAVFGNHEYLAGIAEAEEFYKAANIKVLKDEVAKLGNGLQIVGLDDYSNPMAAREKAVALQVNLKEPSILLDHQPHNLKEKAKLGFDVQISGHTHQGQMFPLNFLTKMLFELDCGYAKIENCHSIVSSGLSLWGPPFRVGTKNEMLILNIFGE